MSDGDTYTQDPRAATDPSAPPGGGLFDRWNSWIDKPGNRAAMMQFGIAMLQPMQQGESFMGHTANAIGYGGEAENRVEQNRQQAEQRESQSDLRSSQAQLAEARAGAAGSRSDTAAANAQLQLEKLNQSRQNMGLNAMVRLQPTYLKEKEDHDLMHPEEPFPAFQEWMEGRGIDPRGTSPAQQGGGATAQAKAEPKPMAKEILANPQYRPRFDLMRKNPNKAQVKSQLDQIAPHVQDPQTLYREFGVQ